MRSNEVLLRSLSCSWEALRCYWEALIWYCDKHWAATERIGLLLRALSCYRGAAEKHLSATVRSTELLLRVLSGYWEHWAATEVLLRSIDLLLWEALSCCWEYLSGYWEHWAATEVLLRSTDLLLWEAMRCYWEHWAAVEKHWGATEKHCSANVRSTELLLRLLMRILRWYWLVLYGCFWG